MYGPYAEAYASEVADLINSRLDRKEQGFVSIGTFALALCANRDAHAFERYRTRMTDPDPTLRRYAVRLASLIKSRPDSVIPLVEAALQDPNDEVAIAAVKALNRLAPDWTNYRDRLIEIAKARPKVGGDIVYSLCAKKHDHPAVLELLRERLKSDDPEQLWLTLSAIASLQRRAAPLRADLEAFAASPAAKLGDVPHYLDAALAALDQDDEDEEADEESE